jgi:hypothetical protein
MGEQGETELIADPPNRGGFSPVIYIIGGEHNKGKLRVSTIPEAVRPVILYQVGAIRGGLHRGITLSSPF